MTTAEAPTSTVIYGRVSRLTTKGEVQGEAKSVDEQIAECRAVAAREGWSVVAEHRDDGISASRFAKGKARPGWQSTMDLITSGKVQLLTVWEISRASRDRAVWTALLAACQENDVKIATGGKVHDPADPDDGFMIDLISALAVRESAMTSKRVRRAVRASIAAGKPPGKIPYGYRRVYDTISRDLIRQEIDPESGSIVREIARRILTGETTWGIATDLNKRQVPTPGAHQRARNGEETSAGRWDITTVKRVAVSPTYCAIRTHKGAEVSEGQWPILITEQDHAILKAKLCDPARVTVRDNATKHLLSGLLECGLCGAACYSHRNGKIPSYECRGKAKPCLIRATRWVDQFVTDVIVARMGQDDALAAYATDGDNAAAADAAEELTALKTRYDAFVDAGADGELSAAALARIEAKLLPQIADAERRATIKVASPVVAELAGPSARAVWDGWGLPQRREAIRALVKIRLLPARRGVRVNGVQFDPDAVQIIWT